jgi:MGT family glycosyltransferase
MTSHVAFFTGSALGHINPLLGLVRELVRRGHRVSWTVTEAFAEVVARAGATPRVYRSPLPADPRRWPADLSTMPLVFLAEAGQVMPDVETLYRADRPDVVVSEDPTSVGMLLAARWGRPAVRVWPYLAIGRHWALADEPGGDPAQRRIAARYLAGLDALLLRRGLPVRAAEYLATAEARHLVLIPRMLHPPGEVFDDRFVFTGPCPDLTRADEPWPAADDGRPLLYVSLGSMNTNHPAFFRSCLDAFGDGSWHLIMSVGAGIELSSFGPLPDHVEVHHTVAQVAVLSRATAFVTHAGMGSVLEALRCAVPMVAVPFLPEQRWNAEQLQRLGVARWMAPEDVRPDRLRRAVDEITSDPGVTERMRAVHTDLLACGGAVAAADEIEALCGHR